MTFKWRKQLLQLKLYKYIWYHKDGLYPAKKEIVWKQLKEL